LIAPRPGPVSLVLGYLAGLRGGRAAALALYVAVGYALAAAGLAGVILAVWAAMFAVRFIAVRTVRR
jgi:hypothetical protein